MFGSLAITGGQIDAFDFRLSCGDFGPDVIPDSAYSPPGRHLLEVFRRTVEASSGCDGVIVSNPILPFTGGRLADYVLEGGLPPLPCVITDEERFPIAYGLPRTLLDRGLGRFLNLLSATRNAPDVLLLAHLAGQRVAKRKAGIKPIGKLPGISPQNYLFGSNPEAWLAQCLNAIAIMDSHPGWAGLPLAAHLPNHAGDVLFGCLASRIDGALDYQQHVVCAAYGDIAEACGGALETVLLDLPPAVRDGTVTDARYFVDSLPHTPGGGFVAYTRFSKAYPQIPLNCIDQVRFSLGAPLRSFEDTVYGRAPMVTNRCSLPVEPLRVLIQFNGGWPMKTYPAEARRVLVQALAELSCQVTVIDLDDAAAYGAAVARAGSVGALTRLINEHHIFVSVDSFPLHYASHILGHPTVALFGPTAPNNSDAPRGAGYRLPLPPMACAPCGANSLCPLTLQRECGNYPRPAEIAAAVLELALECYGYRSAEMAA